jgi:hypothetical protein
MAALEVSLPPAALRSLGDGKIRLTLAIDGKRISQRLIRSFGS